jgi:hypothetical protein
LADLDGPDLPGDGKGAPVQVLGQFISSARTKRFDGCEWNSGTYCRVRAMLGDFLVRMNEGVVRQAESGVKWRSWRGKKAL